jgi:hypothetical protein
MRDPLAPYCRPGWLRLCARLPAAVGLAVLLGGGVAAGSAELGRPAFRDFPPGRNKIGFVNQAVAQDGAGYIYSAGPWNFFCYDGTEWLKIPYPPDAAGPRKFARTSDGTLYAGGAGMIGFLRGSGTKAEFVSLADRLPPTALGCEDLHDVLAAGDTVYFADEEKILRWRGGRFTVIPCPTPPRTRGARLFHVGGATYAAVPGRGLCRLEAERLEDISTAAVLRDRVVVGLEPAPGGGLLALTATHGFFKIDAGQVAPHPVEANRWLTGKTIWRALRLRDGSLAVIFSAVSGDGGMRFDAAGRYAGAIDQTLGLYLREFRDLMQDREGGLWLGSEVGLFRLEWPSPLSIFDVVQGLGAGSVTDLARHDGALYAATTEGFFRLRPADAGGRAAHFERVLAEPISAVVSHPAGLLALGYSSLWAQTPAGFAEVATIPAGGGALVRSATAPDRVWVCSTWGVQSVRSTPQGWQSEAMQLPFGEAMRAVRTAADGSLWISPTGAPGFRIMFSDTDGRPQRAASLVGDQPVEAPAAAPGTRWMARPDAITLVAQDGAELRRLPRLALVSAGAVTCLREENTPAGPALWIGGERGLVRFDLAQPTPAPTRFAALLTATGVAVGASLDPDHPPLAFHYVALHHQIENAVTYQTRLVGLEKEWSAWTRERTRSFAWLPAGSYRFEVRARDADGGLGDPAALVFTVLPPWWLTPWAWLGYAAAAGGVLFGVVRLRTRALRRRAAQLEAIVAERTGELAQKNIELIRLNQLELDEKVSARLAEEKARLEVLRYQLNPHFLFNTLASISGALPAGAATARSMVERLADFCRLTLHRPDDRDWTTVGDEMRLLRTYLEIEQSRWGDLLDLTFDLDPALDGERLPHFLLLPLVENALKYGRATSADRVGLRLVTRRESAGAFVLEVANTGAWVEPAAPKTVSSLGIGLDNLRERLARYYPRTHHLTITAVSGWVIATLRIRSAPATSGRP